MQCASTKKQKVAQVNMPKNNKKSNQPATTPQSAVKVLQQQADELVDDLDVVDNSNENREEILTKLSETIANTLKELKKDGANVLDDYIFKEKISLLERTKSAVEALLVQLLSSPSSSPRAYEALSMVIKVNAELLRDLEAKLNTDAGKPNPTDPGKSGDTIIIAPSEAMLDGIMKHRHKNSKNNKSVITSVED